MNKYYKLFSLTFGTAAVITLTFYLITNFQFCAWFFEPNSLIRIPEIMIGIFILPYYLIKIMEVINK